MVLPTRTTRPLTLPPTNCFSGSSGLTTNRTLVGAVWQTVCAGYTARAGTYQGTSPSGQGFALTAQADIGSHRRRQGCGVSHPQRPPAPRARLRRCRISGTSSYPRPLIGTGLYGSYGVRGRDDADRHWQRRGAERASSKTSESNRSASSWTGDTVVMEGRYTAAKHRRLGPGHSVRSGLHRSSATDSDRQ